MILILMMSLLHINSAQADIYVKSNITLANLTEINTDNIGYSIESGIKQNNYAIGLELSNHMHLNKSTLAVAINGYYFLNENNIRPYLSLGFGSTFNSNPLVQASAGLLFNIKDNLDIYIAYKHRYYFDNFSEVLNIKNYGNSEDGFMEIGLIFRF